MRLIFFTFLILSLGATALFAEVSPLDLDKKINLDKIEIVSPREVQADQLFKKTNSPYIINLNLEFKNFQIYWSLDRKSRSLNLLFKSILDPQKVYSYPVRTLTSEELPKAYGFVPEIGYGQLKFDYRLKEDPSKTKINFIENIFFENNKLYYFEIVYEGSYSQYFRIHQLDINNNIPVVTEKIKINSFDLMGIKTKTYDRISSLNDAGIYLDQKSIYWFTYSNPCPGTPDHVLKIVRFENGEIRPYELRKMKTFYHDNPHPSFFFMEKIGKNFMNKEFQNESCQYFENTSEIINHYHLKGLEELKNDISKYNEMIPYDQYFMNHYPYCTKNDYIQKKNLDEILSNFSKYYYNNKKLCSVFLMSRYYPVLRENGDIYLEAYKEYIDFVENEKNLLNDLSGIVSYPPYEYFIQKVTDW